MSKVKGGRRTYITIENNDENETRVKQAGSGLWGSAAPSVPRTKTIETSLVLTAEITSMLDRHFTNWRNLSPEAVAKLIEDYIEDHGE